MFCVCYFVIICTSDSLSALSGCSPLPVGFLLLCAHRLRLVATLVVVVVVVVAASAAAVVAKVVMVGEFCFGQCLLLL